MVLDSKISACREAFGIEDLADWRTVTPHAILSLDGVGPATLQHIRLYLSQRGLALKDDPVPDQWDLNPRDAMIGAPLSRSDNREVSPFCVVIDTREQLPFQFRGIPGRKKPIIVATSRDGLYAGDYSIKGFETRIAIERKSKADLFSTLGRGREQFQAELERLAEYDVAAVVIEADWTEIATDPPKKSAMSPRSVVRSILAWSQRIPRVHWFPMPGRRAAELTAYRILDRFYQDEISRMAKQHGRLESGRTRHPQPA